MLRATTIFQKRSASSSAPLIRPIQRVLVANRGEIAIRVQNTARKMGIETVSVFSDADRNALFVKKADKAYHIGPPLAAESYLNIDKIIDTALKSGSQAIHPGYGFLSENAGFAERCAQAGLVFVGPPAQAIRDMGAKNVSKQIMEDAKVPVVKGFHGEDQSDANLKAKSAEIGYPVMLKAVYGGGGKGMRIAWSESEFDEKLASARSEAKKSFGNDEMLVEKFVERPRHVEVQVFGDHHGNYVHLWERDCSVQRRHQKIIEEAPAPNMAHETRLKLGESAVKAAAAVGYVGAGTVEFIMDPRGEFYFMEMNTRLQVEHPVSEAITGTDLVEWQLRVAQGEKLPLSQSQIPLNGHAFECRVYAEDTRDGAFMPTAGKLTYVDFPEDARIDTGVVSGDEVSIHYDPMIAKVVVWGADRAAAAAKLESALARTRLSGLPTNIPFVRRVLAHPEFAAGNVYTDFIPDHHDELFEKVETPAEIYLESAVAHALAALQKSDNGVFQNLSFFRVNVAPKYTFKIDGKDVTVRFDSDHLLTISYDGNTFEATLDDVTNIGNDEFQFTLEANGRRWSTVAKNLKETLMVNGVGQNEYETLHSGNFDAYAGAAASHSAVAPMPGIIEKVLVQPGDQVTSGQALVVMTAMKMEYIIRAPEDSTIEQIKCQPGKNVPKNAVLVQFA
uniref:Methylcrotonoyl-CoA carboxylase subunit alpha, mitochondrial n=1 Tax=Caenorhabditis japonica TaxID=281687 RepID=A0A8R1DXQ1_CAEJA